MSRQSSPITRVAAHVHRGLQQRALADARPPPRSRTAGRSRPWPRPARPGRRPPEACTPGAGGGRRACSIRAHKRARATDGSSTTRKSWPGRGFAGVVRRHQHHGGLGARDVGLVFRIAEKGQIAGAGAVPSAADAVDRGGGRAAGGAGLHDGGDLVRREGKLHGR